MEPVTLILTALGAGATAAAKDTATQAIKDAYSGLKSIIQKHFAGKPQAEQALREHETAPEEWKKSLHASLAESGAANNSEVIEKAQRLLQLVHPEQHSQGKYNVQVTGTVQGQQTGDYGTQNNTFGPK